MEWDWFCRKSATDTSERVIVEMFLRQCKGRYVTWIKKGCQHFITEDGRSVLNSTAQNDESAFSAGKQVFWWRDILCQSKWQKLTTRWNICCCTNDDSRFDIEFMIWLRQIPCYNVAPTNRSLDYSFTYSLTHPSFQACQIEIRMILEFSDFPRSWIEKSCFLSVIIVHEHMNSIDRY
jgi:hypothetical protein